MKKIYSRAVQLISISAFILLVNFTSAQSNARVENVDYNMVDKNLVITYDIAKSMSGETFTVVVNIVTTSGKNISAATLTGDVGPGVTGGEGKQIIWDMKKDNASLDGEISVEVLIDEGMPPPMGTPGKTVGNVGTVQAEQQVSIGGALIRSLVLPGLGNYYIKGKGPYWLIGIAGYAVIGTSIAFNNKADDTYRDYQNSLDAAERNQLFSDAESYKQTQDIMMYSAIGIWVADLVWTGIQAGRAKKKAGQSKVDLGYYYNPVVKKPMLVMTYKL